MTWLSVNPRTEPYERQMLAAEIQGVPTCRLTPEQMAESYNLIEQMGCELPPLGRAFIYSDTEEEETEEETEEEMYD